MYIKVNEPLLESTELVSAADANMYAHMFVIFKSWQLLTSSPNPAFHKHHAS